MAFDLASWQKRLENHFRELSDHRRKKFPDRRIFGLEHGLDTSEIQDLSTAVRNHIANAPPAWEHALVWMVYASEIGYRYSGDEYWQTFEQETPGWSINGDRYWIRRCFLWFQKEFCGVEPCGTWAQQFSIICWPITHAILPTDLQRQLARILYELRHSFSSEIFESPTILGDLIAARSWNATSRFQNFAQEAQLIGQIAAALLLEGEFGTGSLHPTALKRIGKDLDRERRARDWLRGARSSARERVQIRGLGLLGRSAKSSDVVHPDDARAVVAELGIEPRLVLRPMDLSRTSWEVALEIPDLSHLLLRFPRVKDILMGSRCVVTGAAGRPLARGRFLYGAQRVVLSRWPHPDEVLLRFEQTDPQLEYLLRTECLLRPSPTRLFRIASDDLAYECRGLRVRPGSQYIIVSTAGPISSREHANQIALSCEGVYGALLNLPPALNEDWEETLRHLGVGQAKSIEVWPAGLSSIVWDGEGHGEWLASERPCLGIKTDYPLASLIISMGNNADDTLELRPVRPGESIFVELPNLPVGLHTVHVSAQKDSAEQAELLGDLDVVMRIREARPWSPGVSPHGPLIVQMEPSAPTLEQFWEGRVDVTLRGPTDRKVNCRVSLFERDSEVPEVTKQLPPMCLPVTAGSWRAHFEKYFRETTEAQNFYDIARICEFEFAAEELGAFTVRCERDFTPLRWALRRQGQGYLVRLFDDSGAEQQPEVKRIAFETPCVEENIGFASEYNVPEFGGMYLAHIFEFMAAIIVPPAILRGLANLGCVPHVDDETRSIESVICALETSKLWGQAKLPGDFISVARQRSVLLALAHHITKLLGGDNWAEAEIVTCNENDSMEVLKKAISRKREETAIGVVLARDRNDLAVTTCEERVNRIALIATRFRLLPPTGELEPEWLSELALRLASDPAGVVAWAQERLRVGLKQLMDVPTLARAARFLVLTTDHFLESRSVPGELYAGWGWT